MLASFPASRLNRICGRFRIPFRSNLMSSRSNLTLEAKARHPHIAALISVMMNLHPS